MIERKMWIVLLTSVFVIGLFPTSISADSNLSFNLMASDYDGDPNEFSPLIYYGVWGDGEFIYTACSSKGIKAYNFEENDFTVIDSQNDCSDANGHYRNIWGDGEFIYTACGDDGVRAYSFDGSSFTLLDTQDDGDYYWNIWGDEGFIYIACFEDGVRAYSFNGDDLTLIDTRHDKGFNREVPYYGVWSDGDYVYAACELGGIRAYLLDTSNNDNNIMDDVKNNDTPGFEIFLIIFSLSIFLFLKKRRRY